MFEVPRASWLVRVFQAWSSSTLDENKDFFLNDRVSLADKLPVSLKPYLLQLAPQDWFKELLLYANGKKYIHLFPPPLQVWNGHR